MAWFAGRNAAIVMALLCVATKLAMLFHTAEPILLLGSMRRHDLPVTFSVGVLSCAEAPETEEESSAWPTS